MTRVAVPLARPSLAALAVFSFLGAWNQYLWPLVSTGGSTPLNTVQIGLKQLLGTQVSQIPVVARRRGHRVRAAGDPAPDLPEAAGAQPHGGRGQVAHARGRPGRCPVLGNRHADLSPPPPRSPLRCSSPRRTAATATAVAAAGAPAAGASQSPELQPQGAGEPQGRRRHHLLGVRSHGQPADAAARSPAPSTPRSPRCT